MTELARARFRFRRPRSYCVPREVIARCQDCGQTFTWLPPRFDMRHRFNSTTREYCGGNIIPHGEKDQSR